jgi:hypothetical protein
VEIAMITCDQLDSLLLEGDDASMAAAAQHARGCTSCADRLGDWNELSNTARSLHETWPSDTLLSRIQRAVARESRPSSAKWWQLAAAIAFTIVLGGGSWFALHRRAEERAFDRAILRDSALHQVESAERAHVAAIHRLEQLASPSLEDPATPLMVSYKAKLLLIDDAINECESVIQQNRNNAQLRKQLLAMYSEKQRTLQDVLREEKHASNQ